MSICSTRAPGQSAPPSALCRASETADGDHQIGLGETLPRDLVAESSPATFQVERVVMEQAARGQGRRYERVDPFGRGERQAGGPAPASTAPMPGHQITRREPATMSAARAMSSGWGGIGDTTGAIPRGLGKVSGPSSRGSGDRRGCPEPQGGVRGRLCECIADLQRIRWADAARGYRTLSRPRRAPGRSPDCTSRTSTALAAAPPWQTRAHRRGQRGHQLRQPARR